jgi:response regulator RpfG family c-di-GMP phosphodiesterase/pSer/pThr/pTyr-binding forkhead associated (FHA) protein
MSHGKVLILEGAHKGQEYAIDQRLTIGRNRDNHIQIPHMRTSRFHAEIEAREDGLWIKDLNSTSGTFVNEEPVKERRLQHGDVLLVGNTRMQLVLPGHGLPVPRRFTSTQISFDRRIVEPATTAEIELNRSDELLRSYSLEAAQRELKRLFWRYAALYRANQLITSEAPPATVYAEVLKQLFAVVPADRGLVLVLDQQTGELLPVATRSTEADADLSHVTVSQTIINRALQDRVSVLTFDAMQDRDFSRRSSVVAQEIHSAVCCPLLYRDDAPLGVIYLDTRSPARAFNHDMLQLVTAVAGTAAVAIKNSLYIEDLKQKSDQLRESYWSTVSVITNAIEARDKYTIGHAWRVTRFGMAIANELGWDAPRKEALEIGGLLHDVGKVGVRDNVLLKGGRLTDEEFSIMRRHPQIGWRIIKDVPFLQAALPYVRSHHERHDGGGYPDGLAGEQIPLEGRLLAIADAFDAMTSDRVYRKCLQPLEAIAEVERCQGTQFDPDLAQCFIGAFRDGKVDYVLQNQARQTALYILCPSCTTYLSLAEGTRAGQEITCPVCRKRLLLTLAAGQLAAELAQ